MIVSNVHQRDHQTMPHGYLIFGDNLDDTELTESKHTEILYASTGAGLFTRMRVFFCLPFFPQ
jgi:hypothetical protein